MTVREAKLSDAEALYVINRDSLGYNYPLDKTKEQLKELLKLPDNKLFVYTVDDNIYGYIHATIYQTIYAPKMINILALSVDPSFQGKGCGKELVQAAEQWAATVDAVGIRLNSGEERKAAHQFYEHIGFTKRKNQANYYKMIG